MCGGGKGRVQLSETGQKKLAAKKAQNQSAAEPSLGTGGTAPVNPDGTVTAGNKVPEQVRVDPAQDTSGTYNPSGNVVSDEANGLSGGAEDLEVGGRVSLGGNRNRRRKGVVGLSI